MTTASRLRKKRWCSAWLIGTDVPRAFAHVNSETFFLENVKHIEVAEGGTSAAE